MKYFKMDDLNIAYNDTGSGTPVILVHCSSASHKKWLSLTDLLKKQYRILTPDLIGYGNSDLWPLTKEYDASGDVRVIMELAKLINQPFHLAGHSYGAAMALESARILGNQVKSLTLVEPVAFHLLQLADKTVSWNQMINMSRRIQTYASTGKYRKAASIYMRYWVGPLRWQFMPGKQKKYIFDTMPKVTKEFSIIEKATVSLDDYKVIQSPTRLIMGSRTRIPAKDVIDILLENLPDCVLKIIPGAGHMSPFTHRKIVNQMISEHIMHCEGKV